MSINGGNVNVSLDNNSVWYGRADDYQDADIAGWAAEHLDVFSPIYTDTSDPLKISSGNVNIKLNGSTWHVTGQSWISSLEGNNATIDLTGESTDINNAIHIGKISGTNNFVLNVSPDGSGNMIYVKDGTGAAQNIIINNRNEVLSQTKEGDVIRFATVSHAGNGFSDGNISANPVSTFGKSTQIRDVGTFNVSFSIEYRDINTDPLNTSEYNDAFNGSENTENDGLETNKPGTKYVEENYNTKDAQNVYLVREAHQTVDDVSDAGKSIIDMSRSNYANAVYMDTLNKRQGEARFVGSTDHGVWVRLRHDNIGKDDSFRTHNTMVEVGFEQRDVNDYGEFHTGFALDYMNGQIDYHTVDGDGDIERYGVWFYTTYLGNDGQYADLVLKYGHLKNDFGFNTKSQGEHVTGDYTNEVASISAEYGWKFSNSYNYYIEPQAQLQYSYVTGADYTTSQGSKVDLDSIHSLIGRVGFRAGKDFNTETPITAYIRGDVLHEFLGDQDIYAYDNTGVMDVTYENDDTWYSAGVGLSVQSSENTYFFIEGEQVFGADNDNTYTVSGGFKHSF